MNAEEYILSSSGLGLPEDGDDSHHSNQAVMNEKVQSLAGSIYEEFESMILRYDTDVVKSLMPLIVNVLESLDLSYTEIQEYEVELELLKEDNEQLVTQYEREKALRKSAESKNIEFEDNFEGERKDLNVKIESLSSIVKMFELKSKNNQEHINRLEEKENEMKREYSKLHDRYTELFKTHIDYMERAKNFLGSEKMEQMHGPSSNNRTNRMSALNQLNRSTGPISFGYSELEGYGAMPSLAQPGSSSEQQHSTTPDVNSSEKPTNLRNELIGAKASSLHTESSSEQKRMMVDKAWANNGELSQEIIDLEVEEAEDISQDPSVGPATPTSPVKMGLSQTKVETRTGNTLYQELSFQDADALGDVDEGADITGGWVHPGEFASADHDFDDSSCFSLEDNILLGMGKEVENLISENNELLATKNALNIVKDDLIAKVDELTGEHEILREEIKSLQNVRSRCQTRISELEEEVKKLKEDMESKSKGAKTEGEEDDVPMAQRKRFTRVEMARVLMERNQYKEKFMELQEAVRFTEIMRATRSENPIDKKSSRMGIWKLFGNLFSANNRSNFEGGGSNKPMIPYVNMKISGSNENMSSAAGNERKGAESRRNFSSRNELFDGDSLSNARRSNERKEQYKQVRAHVKKDDGRTHAYGWSLPVNTETSGPSFVVDGASSSSAVAGGEDKSSSASTPSSASSIPVPVPVYCQPLMKKEPGMKIWCAAGVNLTGGRPKKPATPSTSSGSSSMFDESKMVVSEKEAANLDAIRACNNELDQIDRELKAEEKPEEVNEELSSHIWICTSTHSISKVTVIDANDPVNVIESFHVCSSHLLCIASVPGVKHTDFKYDQEWSKSLLHESESKSQKNEEDESKEDAFYTSLRFVSVDQETGKKPVNDETPQQQEEEEGKEEAQSNEEDVDAVHRRFLKDSDTSNMKKEESPSPEEKEEEEEEKMSSVLPTMWLGSQSGSIYVHSAVSQWKRCIHSIKLNDSVLCILHLKGRVLVALANGTIAIFHRGPEGEWDLGNYHLLDLGKPHFSIRCMTQVHDGVWCGYRNKVFVIDPQSMAVQHTFDAHPRKESQVRQMACFGDGVWVSIRLDSTLRLYHAHNYQHLQDVDIEPYVSKMLGPAKYGFSFVRITSLLISCHRLWMGTGNGVIISVPFVSSELLGSNAGTTAAAATKSSSSTASDKKLPGGLVRVYNSGDDQYVLSNKKFIPYCSLSQAQLSFHGHRDSVKFFVSVPGNDNLESTSLSPSSSISGEKMLVVSGGEGYIDFRMVDDGSDQDYDSHMMVWQLPKVKFVVHVNESDSISLKSTESILNSWESNSIDLGPTPGSGVVTTADTSAESDTDTTCEQLLEDPPEEEEEKLLEALPVDDAEEESTPVYSPSQGYVSSCNSEPIEDFTQMPFLKTETDAAAAPESTKEHHLP